jgi:GNAT superfamily N-acetyltransferase
MTGSPTVATPNPDDKPVLEQVAGMLGDSLPPACRGLAAYDAPRYHAYLAAALTVPPPSRTLLLRTAWQAGELVAVADWRCPGESLFLNGIYVRPAWRGQGLARRLIADGVDLARAAGVGAIELHVSEDNPSATALYRKWGFQPTGSHAWQEIPVDPDREPEQPVRVLDWPGHAAHYTAYGFGDLTVAHGQATTRARRIGRALCVGPTTGAGVPPYAALARLLATERAYRITGETDDAPAAFASFIGMRASLAELARNVGAA